MEHGHNGDARPGYDLDGDPKFTGNTYEWTFVATGDNWRRPTISATTHTPTCAVWTMTSATACCASSRTALEAVSPCCRPIIAPNLRAAVPVGRGRAGPAPGRFGSRAAIAAAPCGCDPPAARLVQHQRWFHHHVLSWPPEPPDRAISLLSRSAGQPLRDHCQGSEGHLRRTAGTTTTARCRASSASGLADPATMPSQQAAPPAVWPTIPVAAQPGTANAGLIASGPPAPGGPPSARPGARGTPDFRCGLLVAPCCRDTHRPTFPGGARAPGWHRPAMPLPSSFHAAEYCGSRARRRPRVHRRARRVTGSSHPAQAEAQQRAVLLAASSGLQALAWFHGIPRTRLQRPGSGPRWNSSGRPVFRRRWPAASRPTSADGRPPASRVAAAHQVCHRAASAAAGRRPHPAAARLSKRFRAPVAVPANWRASATWCAPSTLIAKLRSARWKAFRLCACSARVHDTQRRLAANRHERVGWVRPWQLGARVAVVAMAPGGSARNTPQGALVPARPTASTAAGGYDPRPRARHRACLRRSCVHACCSDLHNSAQWMI
ncbi:hypothetical protein FQR65_LT20703 [Abscondita terminalis]|nr:hypothetical protein FQR65_LT20703 [Abscondita terminalis]